MSECCCAPLHAGRVCPSCGAIGAVVDATTVRAMLVPAALLRFEHGGFHFCAGASCAVVYFSCAGATFRTADLNVQVWQKTAPGDRTVCYCFGENEADIRREIEVTGRSAAIERVRAGIANHRCACAVRNPRGVCCLGDLVAATKAVAPRLRVRA